MIAPVLALPSADDLERLFRQKHGDPNAVGWSPRRRHRFNYSLPSDVYEAMVAKLATEGTAWIDIGGGHNIFPENPGLARTLAARCSIVVAVDPSENVNKNQFATERVQALIEEYTTNRRFNLATLRMVAEHIADPAGLTDALARLLAPGGFVVILTVNRMSPLTLMSRLTPFWLHHPLKRLFWGSEEEDTFPVQYRMNSRSVLHRLMARGGFEEVLFAYLDDLSTWSRFRGMSYVELLAWRALKRLGISYPENCLLGVYRKN